jgi:hypothetical protein
VIVALVIGEDVDRVAEEVGEHHLPVGPGIEAQRGRDDALHAGDGDGQDADQVAVAVNAAVVVVVELEPDIVERRLHPK